MNWRIAETWRSFLDRRELWFQRSKGIDKPPGRPPTLTDDIKADIRRALKVHDGELLGEDDREEWLRDSKTRAAGEGMFLKEWNVGLREGTNGDGARGSTYTEPWRPWKIRKGRDPVDEFAEVYFVKRAASEARR